MAGFDLVLDMRGRAVGIGVACVSFFLETLPFDFLPAGNDGDGFDLGGPLGFASTGAGILTFFKGEPRDITGLLRAARDIPDGE